MLSNKQGEKHYEELKEIIAKSHRYWARISKKGSGFFFFLSEWSLYVNNVMLTFNIFA